jgi:hypothetical protein
MYSSRWDGGTFAKYNKAILTNKPSWYGVSSPKEFFAEMYTRKYTGGAMVPGSEAFFNDLDTATDADLSAAGIPTSAPAPVAAGEDTKPVSKVAQLINWFKNTKPPPL